MTDHRNDATRYRQCMDDWHWLTAEAEAQDRRALYVMDDDARREWRPTVPKWLPFFVVAVVFAASIGASLVLEWWLRGAG